jgi:hypothetical protein
MYITFALCIGMSTVLTLTSLCIGMKAVLQMLHSSERTFVPFRWAIPAEPPPPGLDASRFPASARLWAILEALELQSSTSGRCEQMFSKESNFGAAW